VDHAEHGTDGQRLPHLEPLPEQIPCPAIHADFAPAAALAMADDDRAATVVKVALARASASLIRMPERQSTTMSPRSRKPSARCPAPNFGRVVPSRVELSLLLCMESGRSLRRYCGGDGAGQC
jgi:hypothetical protein